MCYAEEALSYPCAGAILTKMDGDSRGGAALSVREVGGAWADRATGPARANVASCVAPLDGTHCTASCAGQQQVAPGVHHMQSMAGLTHMFMVHIPYHDAQVSGKPIKFVGVGEKMDSLEPFYPERMASRVLGMGDVLTLYEKAASAIKVCMHGGWGCWGPSLWAVGSV